MADGRSAVNEPEDWRFGSPGADLADQSFRWTTWTPPRASWDHDHCSFCWAKITDLSKPPDDDHDYFRAGWVTGRDRSSESWVCAPCMVDLGDHFNLRTDPTTPPPATP